MKTLRQEADLLHVRPYHWVLSVGWVRNRSSQMPDLFLAMLLGWCVLWIIPAGIDLLRTAAGHDDDLRKRKGFWSMTLFWIAIDVGIVGWAIMDPVESTDEFRRLLLINSGLDVVYLLVGSFLLRRSDPLVRGFGAAILIQGGFLLLFDLAWWWCLAPGG